MARAAIVLSAGGLQCSEESHFLIAGWSYLISCCLVGPESSCLSRRNVLRPQSKTKSQFPQIGLLAGLLFPE